ncbi:hypothetical protein JFQ84_000808 [Aeromonas hydrophila]|nr:hypothetical protein [Aeromonas hydrophila]
MTTHQVLIGKEKWLFLQNDTNQLIRQITGEYAVSDSLVNYWSNILKLRSSFFRSRNIEYTYICAPNKECVYKKYLPDNIILSNKRPLELFRPVFESILGDSFCYPLAALQIGLIDTFSKGDTHWNQYGAFVAYQELMQSMGVQNKINIEDVDFIPAERKGDLISKLPGNHLDNTVLAKIKIQSSIEIEFDNHVQNRGKLVVINNHHALNDDSVVIFRDSFGSALVHFLARTFRRVVAVWQPNIDLGIIEAESPKYVISEQVERFIVSPPNDISDKTHNQICTSKEIFEKYYNIL